MKIEINIKIILLGILFFVLKQFDIYVIFIIFITLHELSHLIVGLVLRIKTKNDFNKSIRNFYAVLHL